MARSQKLYTDSQYAATFDNFTADIPANFEGLGYYRRLHLEDIINNFIVAYIGAGKTLVKVPRHEVAFWAQRGVQEFSYDVFQQDKAIEIDLPESKVVILPHDFVNLVKVVSLDSNGIESQILPAAHTRSSQAILQDDDYEYNYDFNGELLYAEESEGVTRWREKNAEGALDFFQNYYYGSEYDGEFDYYSYYYNQGRRYGSMAEDLNTNPEYVLDLQEGKIYFGSRLDAGDAIQIRYVSDGLCDAGDLTSVYVPKLAEDAIYAWILYNLSKVRPSAAGAVPLYKKESSAKMRNAKIRLQNYRLEEMTQVMRGKSKWIKH